MTGKVFSIPVELHLIRIAIRVIHGLSGADVYAEQLCDVLNALDGVSCSLQFFPQMYQYVPWLLQWARPTGADLVVSNAEYSWVFQEPQASLWSIAHTDVLSPEYQPHTSVLQKLYHHGAVKPHLRKSLQQTTVTVAVAAHVQASLSKHLPTTTSVVMQNAIDTDVFRPPAVAPTEDRCHLLFVGNLTRRKGADLLPRIMQKLGPDFSLAYTRGKRPCRVPHSFRRANMQSLGTVERADLVPHYQQCHLALFPSRLEGMSLAVLEAMACGCPIVASACNGMEELVEPGVNGVLCPPGDVNAFVTAIQTLWENPTLRQAMSRRSRQRAVDLFGLETYSQRWLSLLQTTSHLPTPQSRTAAAESATRSAAASLAPLQPTTAAPAAAQ